MLRSTLLCAVLISAGSVFPLLGQDKSGLDNLLGHVILEKGQTLTDVQNFCEARLPPMPQVKSAAEWDALAAKMRDDVLKKAVYRGAASAWRDAESKVEWLDTIPGGPGYRIKKLRFEALPGVWIPALLYEPEQMSGKVPVVLNVNGHDRNGKAADYKQIRCINQAKRGMLALNLEWLGMGQLGVFSHAYMNQLDLCGTSGLAPFYLSMKRGLDVLLAHPHADPARVAVAGLSGGGWQTIIISSLDPRVTLSNPVAGYSSFKTRIRHHSDLGDSEQTPVDLATGADYDQLTAMRAPRPTLLTFNANDECCFKADHALPPLLAAAGPFFKLYGKEQNLRSHINTNPGTHNFLKDNREALYRMLGDHFYAGDATFKPEEIPSDSEVKTKEQLNVPLPDPNPSFQTLALDLSKTLPRKPELPADTAALASWQAERRARLREVVKSPNYKAQVERAGEEQKDGVKATYWKLKMEPAGKDSKTTPEWQVPVVELVRGVPKGTTLLLADGGRTSAAPEVAKLLAAEQRVLAVDPFYFGESKIDSRAYLFALMISTVGERPLGVQSAQVGAVARWAMAEFKAAANVVAIGPRTSLIALVATGLEDQAIGGVSLQGSLGSLKEVLEQNRSFDQMPELFCFGLLEEFDVRQLVGLVAPRSSEFPAASERVQKELSEVKIGPKK